MGIITDRWTHDLNTWNELSLILIDTLYPKRTWYMPNGLRRRALSEHTRQAKAYTDILLHYAALPDTALVFIPNPIFEGLDLLVNKIVLFRSEDIAVQDKVINAAKYTTKVKQERTIHKMTFNMECVPSADILIKHKDNSLADVERIYKNGLELLEEGNMNRRELESFKANRSALYHKRVEYGVNKAYYPVASILDISAMADPEYKYLMGE